MNQLLRQLVYAALVCGIVAGGTAASPAAYADSPPNLVPGKTVPE